ncbi:hypothetical protein CBW65_22920 [Tumebacillus avium]|uniref:Carrier domain-containing protein n=1 Tax=Tumebacillus avium TaxID=1903704 RepID=A0A1Y0ITB5_9BACL|nr:non-ribosomal peptide synthetase [Tumebacillus avium]ARU63540.1 hypothetical protein CBW65_22920 [Tumebacillus avium]
MTTKNLPATRRSKLSGSKQALLEARLRGGKQAEQAEEIQKRAAGTAPLSFAQQRMWILDRLDPGNSVYNVPMICRLQGSLQTEVLEQALQEIVQRHEVLRTTFAEVNRQLIQQIQEVSAFDLTVLDLSNLPLAQREEQAKRAADAEAGRGFDLTHGPLFRALLIRLAADEHLLVLNLHHIVSDGWSTSIFMRELSVLYRAFSAGEPSPLPPLAIQYADFAAWQREQLAAGKELKAQEAYWQQHLAGTLPVLQLPTDHPRPPVQSYNGDYLTFPIPAATAQRIQELSRREGATLFMTLLAAYKTLLHRYTGQDDILIGSPVAGRNRTEIEELIGFFVNTLVFRTDLSGESSFRQVLQKVRESCLNGFSNQDVPFEKLVELLQPERDRSYSPLFQSMFILQNNAQQSLELGGVTVTQEDASYKHAKFDLSLAVQETEGGMIADLEYNTDLFERATIERMAGHFLVLLEGIAADPDQPIATLPLLTAVERQQLLVDWNETAVAYPHNLHFHEMFEAQAERTPDAVAVSCKGEFLTYGELNERANRLARRLQQHGAAQDVFIGICVDRSLWMAVGLLGILKAGSAYVPLDPSYPSDRLAYMVEDAKVPLLLTESHLLGVLPDAHGAKTILLDSEWEDIATESAANLQAAVEADHLAYMIYTSGSTGRPKGTMIRHGGLSNYLNWCTEAYEAKLGTGVPVHSSIAFDLTITGIFAPLAVGQKVLIVPQDDGVESLVQVLREEENLTYIKLTPAHLKLLSQTLTGAEAAKMARGLVIGGEQLTGEDIAFWRKHAPHTKLYNEYGPTETVVGCVVYDVPADDTTAGAISIGRPIANTELYVLDAALQPVPIGVPGELYIGGAGVARGYLNRPDLTEERFVRHPFGKEDTTARLYKTGDLVRYLPDGKLEFIGRIDHQVKIRGFRIELGEIETVILEHPDVKEAIVIDREDVPGDKRLVAYVVSGEEQDLEALRIAVAALLPDYMVPSAFVPLTALPLTSNGKVDRKALPAPQQTRTAETPFVEPRSALEQRLAAIWAEVLGIEAIGLLDSFFKLGGHSLLATQVMSRVQEEFGVRLPLSSMFAAKDLSEFVRQVQSAVPVAEEQGTIQPVSRTGRLPLSFSQMRLWFFDRFTPGSSMYNMAHPFRLQGELSVPALTAGLNEIVRRHEALRTTFIYDDIQPAQVIAPLLTIEVPLIELTALPFAEREAEALRLAKCEAMLPFDLEQGPLMRAQLIRLSEQDHLLLLNMHHIVSDGWSMSVFLQELAELYEAHVQGREHQLAPLPIQYADFAAWHRAWMQGDVFEEQLAYWKQKLSGSLPVLELPISGPRKAEMTHNGAAHGFHLSAELRDKLQEICQRTGATMYMTLLAAFKTLLFRYTGQDDLLIGSPIAGRGRRELEALIGMFINTLVLRTDLTGNPSFAELVGRVKDVTLEAYTHQDIPFEKLVDELQPERNLAHSPLFQVMFMLQNMPSAQPEMAGVKLEPVAIEENHAKFDLTLAMQESADGMIAYFEYNRDLFGREAIERMAGHFLGLLEGIAADPDQPIATLPLLTAVERQQLLVDWNETAVAYPHNLHFHEMFEAQAERTPDAVAVSCKGEFLTYGELNERANRLARRLQQHGAAPDVFIGICVDRSLWMAVGLLGILKAGSAYVPLDPSYPSDRLAYMVEDAKVPLLLTESHLLGVLPDAHGAKTILLDSEWEDIATESAANLQAAVEADHLAYMIYTSGSTGRPKGTMIRHGGLSNYLNWCTEAYEAKLGTGVPVHSSIAFDLTITGIFAPLAIGQKVLIVPQDDGVESLVQVLREEENLTYIKLTPAHLKLLSQTLTGTEAAKMARGLVIGGEQLTGEDIAFWRKHAPHTKLYNEYGPTETVVGCVVYDVPADDTTAGAIPIGRPIANTELYVLDSALQPVPIGVPGELYIGGAGVARGYLNRPDLTEERFVRHPFGKEDTTARLYKTGDLVRYLPDGKLEFIGRIDHQVKIRGFRIELGEIETVILEHPDVKEAIVIDREDVPGVKRLVGYIIPAQGAELSTARLREHLLAALPDYMVPHAFVLLENIPLTSNGKVDRKLLPAPDRQRSEERNSFAAPSTPMELLLAEVWQEVLGLERVGVQENFFELGGDSIIGIQIIAKAKRAGVSLTPKQLFQHQTIAQLALVAKAQEQTPQAEQGLVSGSVPLLPIQRWFFEQKLPEPHHWNMSALFAVDSSVTAPILREALQAVVLHHDAMRLRFTKTGAVWKQDHAEPQALSFDIVDLSDRSEAEAAQAIQASGAQLQTSLSLEGPLQKAVYFDLGSGHAGRLLFAIHHLVMDGVSWRIVLEDLQTACRQLLQGQLVALPPKTTSFKRWSEMLVEYAQTKRLSKEAESWLTQAKQETAVYPVDFPDGANLESSVQKVSRRLSVTETQDLLKGAPKAYRTQINDLLLAALARAMAKSTGQNAVRIDLEGHGREDLGNGADLSRTVGWFTTQFPVLLAAGSVEASESDTIKAVKEQLRQIPNKGIGYGLLRSLRDDDTAEQLRSQQPAQISFNYLGQFEQESETGALFTGAGEAFGKERSPVGTRSHQIQILAVVTQGQLTIEWEYSSNLHRTESMERLAELYMQALRGLIGHCMSPGAGGYTPSDFKEARLSQRSLDTLMLKLASKKRR